MNNNRIAWLGSICLIIIITLFTQNNVRAQSALDLAVHYVEGRPADGEIAYNVDIYLSAVDGKGNPIRDLQSDAFTIAEDSNKVEIQNLRIQKDEPVSIILVMDASGSMAGPGIKDAKDAATAFVSGLGPNDQVAILTFDNNIRNQIDFTTDRKAITDRIAQIDAMVDSDSCLFEAAYRAVEMMSSEQKTGNRAIILFTDGTDETIRGSVCSPQTKDNVISTANDFIKHTPIFTIGIGAKADPAIKEIAEQTGGLYLSVSSTSKLTNIFQVVSDQLRSQYILTYKSLSPPGPHRVTVEVKQFDTVADKDTRNFMLDPIPTQIVFTSPQENETVGGLEKITVNVLAQSEIVQRVAFEVNDTVIGTDEFAPYELDLDMKQFPVGATKLAVVAYGANNVELQRSSINVTHIESEEESQVVSQPTSETASTTETAPTTPEPESKKSTAAMGFVLGGLGIVIIAVLLFIVIRQQQGNNRKDDDDYELNPMLDTPQGIPVYSRKNESRSPISLRVNSDALGALVIEASDDSSMLGHHFDITSSSITLGRSAENDLNFPNDKPVSRRHAEIFLSNKKLYLRAIETSDASGVPQLPKYGTFLNEIPVGADSVVLKTGDEIQLGKRVRLKFEAYQPVDDEDARTYDDMAPDEDMDRTQEQ